MRTPGANRAQGRVNTDSVDHSRQLFARQGIRARLHLKNRSQRRGSRFLPVGCAQQARGSLAAVRRPHQRRGQILREDSIVDGTNLQGGRFTNEESLQAPQHHGVETSMAGK